MRPAFSSTKEAAAFASLLLLLLAAPWLAHLTFLPQRAQTQSSQSIRWEKFPWVQKFIDEETNDIDIAFIGSSHLAHAIDAPYVQEKLSERVGHQTAVRTIFFTSPGFDALYFFTKDLLAHRRVKTLVFYDECSGQIPYRIHPLTHFWFRCGDDEGVLSGLPWNYQLAYYYAAIIGMPRNVLELFVPNIPMDANAPMRGPFALWHAANPATTLGCIKMFLSFDSTYDLHSHTNFASYRPQNGVTPADVCVFSPATATNFAFSDRPLPISQTYFANKFGLLAKTHGCSLLALYIPSFDERAAPVASETRYWPDLMQTDVCLMGIPSRRLFAGLSEVEIEKLYYDPGHVNVNGQQYYTSLFTPALIDFYESHSRR